MFHSAIHRPAIHPHIGNIDHEVTIAIDSISPLVNDQRNFVGWAYQCLRSPSTKATAISALHKTLSLRELVLPEEKPLTAALWDKLFNPKKHLNTQRQRSARRPQAVEKD